MSKSVLVICSSPEGLDYPAKDNQDMLNTLLKGEKPAVDFLPGGDKPTFPEDMPKRLYDIILLAGCNALIFISLLREHETSIQMLSKHLTPNGVIVVTESEQFIKKYISVKHYDEHKLTVTLEELLKANPSAGIQDRKKEFEAKIAYWKTQFNEERDGMYIVYRKKAATRVSGEPKPKPNPEELCAELLRRIKELPAKVTFTEIIKNLTEFIKEKKLKINIVEKKGAKQKAVNSTWTNVRAAGDTCKALCDILENGEEAASKRLKQIFALVRSSNTTRKNQKASVSGAAFDPADPRNRRLAVLNAKIGADLDAEYTPEVEDSPLIKMGYPGKIKPNDTLFTCEALDIALESLNADGNNSDCFVHSFLLDTCPNLRAAKVKSTRYLDYVKTFRTRILPLIVDWVFKQPDFVPESPEFDAKAIQEDLLTASEFLSDDLIKAVCYYYDICMVIIGPGNPRVSRVLYSSAAKADSYPPAYVISNAHGTHWEPVRIIGTGQYLLEPDYVECIVKTYSGAAPDNEDTMARERAFKELDKIKRMAPDAIAAYIALPENKPGEVTELFILGNEQVLALERLKDRLVQHYKNTGGFQKSREWQDRSDELIEDLKDEQINEVNEVPVDIEGITRRVNEFIAPPPKKRAVPKKGGRRTQRLRRT
jgi:hypothetical protein